MINTCIKHLEDSLKSIGFTDTEILTDEEAINKYKGARFAGIAFSETQLTKDGVRVGSQDDLKNMKRIYRYRLYKISIPVIILLVDNSKEAAEAHLLNFLTSLGSHIKDSDKNPIMIAGGDPQWLEDRSLLNQRTGVELPIVFSGGIYTDKEIKLINLESAMEIETEIGGVPYDS